MESTLPRRVVATGLILASTTSCRGNDSALPEETGELVRTMTAEVDGQRLSYHLVVPAGDRPPAGWPLLLFLHGAGERGSDLELVKMHGPHKQLGRVPELQDCVFLAPQCPADEWWRIDTLLALIEEVRDRAPIDASRLYLTGLSMGGYGTWNLLAAAPELFAAAIPICGGGQPARLWPEIRTAFEIERLLLARNVPIRAFHGELDEVVPAEESILLVRALEEAGADVELEVYPGVAHDSWTQTYERRELWSWLFAQRRG